MDVVIQPPIMYLETILHLHHILQASLHVLHFTHSIPVSLTHYSLFQVIYLQTARNTDCCGSSHDLIIHHSLSHYHSQALLYSALYHPVQMDVADSDTVDLVRWNWNMWVLKTDKRSIQTRLTRMRAKSEMASMSSTMPSHSEPSCSRTCVKWGG